MSRLLLLLALACAAFAVAAQAPAARKLSAYVSGGVGEDEREVLLPHKNDFNLHLVFAVRRSGNYLAGVEVRIVDAQGAELLRIESDGPFLFAQLAPDTYTISATYGGETQSRRVQIGPQGATAVSLYWDDPAALEGKGMEPERVRRR